MRFKNLVFKQIAASADSSNDFSKHELYDIYRKIRAHKLVAKDKDANNFMRPTIKTLREQAKYIATMAYVITFSNRNYELECLLENWATVKTTKEKLAMIKAEMEYFKSEIKQERANRKKLTVDECSSLGFNYETIGGVFIKPGSVIALQNIENQLSRIRTSKKPNKNSTSNYVGIELELVAKVDRSMLNTLFCKAYLAGYVYVKDDSSIQRENNSDFSHEVTILCKQNDVKDVVSRVCAVLNSKEVSSYVNNSCGLHVHIDCRQRDPKVLYNNFVRSLGLLKSMVPKNRVESTHAMQYCKMNKTYKFEDAGTDRYQAINPQAYSSYKTIEIRMHSGSTNAQKIVNWVSVLLGIAKHATTITCDVNTPAAYNDTFGCDTKLTEFMTKRITTFGGDQGVAFDTRSDHFFNNNLDFAV